MRLRKGDVLFAMLDELCREAMTLPIVDCDRRENWRASCHALLQAVKDPAQKLAWSMELAQALAVRSELPVKSAMTYLRTED